MESQKMKRKSFLLHLIKEMQKAGSWTGETHIQKSIYFLHNLLDIPLEYEYTFYKHGPYSFELREELNELRAEKFLRIIPREPYGVSYETGDYVDVLKKKYNKLLEKFSSGIDFVTNEISTKTVKDLERLSTALYVYKEENIEELNRMVEKIRELKPHLTVDEAKLAAEEMSEILGSKRIS